MIETLLALLLTVTPTPALTPEHVAEVCAGFYGVDPKMAQCIVQAESRWENDAVGDRGKAVGLWQWHAPSIKLVMRAMDWEWDWRTQGDPRRDVVVSTAAACYAIGEMDLGRWWSTYAKCSECAEGE